ncbi:MAG: RNA-binding S4 domain-containing protein [Proteobacteria bacterium]|nr:RNA-binding S4 domain-containing protein [Pseudomonadota bacterium]
MNKAPATPRPAIDRQRLDKWLWHTRLQPTRSKAAQFIKDGHARLNGQRVTDPARTVQIGDILTLALVNRTVVARIQQILPARVSATRAAATWETPEH